MEAGHHGVVNVCRELNDSGMDFGRLGFIHHGREILDGSYFRQSRMGPGVVSTGQVARRGCS
jgi:hypothetical protein